MQNHARFCALMMVTLSYSLLAGCGLDCVDCVDCVCVCVCVCVCSRRVWVGGGEGVEIGLNSLGLYITTSNSFRRTSLIASPRRDDVVEGDGGAVRGRVVEGGGGAVRVPEAGHLHVRIGITLLQSPRHLLVRLNRRPARDVLQAVVPVGRRSAHGHRLAVHGAGGSARRGRGVGGGEAKAGAR